MEKKKKKGTKIKRGRKRGKKGIKIERGRKKRKRELKQRGEKEEK